MNERAGRAEVHPMGAGRLALLAAVIGPGLLAGLSDDDPAGITTYSVLGAEFGYQLLWVLVLSTVCLILFHGLGARMGLVTGQGLIGLTRQRYGVRLAGIAAALLVVANLGTACAEFAGIAAGFELFGISRYLSVPLSAALVSTLVTKGSFHRVERVFMVISSVFLAYILSGILAGPDWSATARGLVVPTIPGTRDAVLIATATIGTTLAPWGLSFIQSYAADKRLTVADLRNERVDVIVGATLTGVIGVFVVIACAATLWKNGVSIDDAADASRALEPLAGGLASALFAVGLIGAGVLGAAILPLSTAYSVSEFVGTESAVDDEFSDARLFYITYFVVAGAAAGLVLIPGMPLVTVLVSTQVLNAVLLVPLLAFMYGIARDRDLMGSHTATRVQAASYLFAIALITVCLGALLVASVG